MQSTQCLSPTSTGFPPKCAAPCSTCVGGCRQSSSTLIAQLCSMQSIGCHISCMTAQLLGSSAVIGLSSGKLLHISVNKAHTDVAPDNDSDDHNIAELVFAAFPEQHTAAVSAAQLSSDGHMLASLSSSHDTIFIWDCASSTAAGFQVMSRQAVHGAACLAWLPARSHDTSHRLLLGCNNGDLVVSNSLVARCELYIMYLQVSAF